MITDHTFEPNPLNAKRCGRLRDSGYGLCWTPEEEHQPSKEPVQASMTPEWHRLEAERIMARAIEHPGQDAQWALANMVRALVHATLARG